MYLCCAAAYADVVVAEKATVHRPRESLPRVVPGAVVVPNLRELQAVLQAAPGTM